MCVFVCVAETNGLKEWGHKWPNAVMAVEWSFVAACASVPQERGVKS